MNEVFSTARNAIITAYIKLYDVYIYDRKANATLVQKYHFRVLLNGKLSSVNDHIGKSLAKWLPLYRVDQVLTNSNYVIRNVGTNYTQCVHRIRLRPITPLYTVEDIPQINPTSFTLDPITRHCSEPSVFDQTTRSTNRMNFSVN